jgi:hypothetical protein
MRSRMRACERASAPCTDERAETGGTRCVSRVGSASEETLSCDKRAGEVLDLLARGEGESAGELLRADADEAELAVPGILAVVQEGQE